MLGEGSQYDLKGWESSISRHSDAQFRFSADLEQPTVVEVVDVADAYATIVMASNWNICFCPSFAVTHCVTVECLVREARIILNRYTA